MASSSENVSPKKFQSKRSMRRGSAGPSADSSISETVESEKLSPVVSIVDLAAGQNKYVFVLIIIFNGYPFSCLCLF